MFQQVSHGRLCFQKKQQPRKLKPWPKHPIKIHLWAGISYQGATPAVLFTRILNSTRFCSILKERLIPFLSGVYPNGHRFQQDNDPKHCSNYTKNFLDDSAGGGPQPRTQVSTLLIMSGHHSSTIYVTSTSREIWFIDRGNLGFLEDNDTRCL